MANHLFSLLNIFTCLIANFIYIAYVPPRLNLWLAGYAIPGTRLTQIKFKK